MPKKALIDNYSKEELQQFIDESSSMKEFGEKIGYKAHTGALAKVLKTRIENYGLVFTTWQPASLTKRTKDNVFCKDSTASQRTLRLWYEKENTDYKCSICGQEPVWNNKPLSMTLDHINGDNKDDRLENLRWVCPNCDRQLDTFAGKNISQPKKEYLCSQCGCEISKGSQLCLDCANKAQRTVERPSRQELKDLIRVTPFTVLGAQFHVSDNAIRKWCIAENLPSKSSVIKSYLDEEWELV